MIDEPGHPTGHLVIPLNEETTMLKTISAALLAVSVLAAPAMAASSNTQTPANKADQAPTAKTAQAPTAKTGQLKPSVLKANAKMGHHGKHFRHHRSHHMSALKTHQASKVTIKHAPATKRG
jgi:hypothetical protein